MVETLRRNESCGIVVLKLGGMIYEYPWSGRSLFQHNDVDKILGFDLVSGSYLDGQVQKRDQAFGILYEGQKAYIMEWDAGDFFERPVWPAF